MTRENGLVARGHPSARAYHTMRGEHDAKEAMLHIVVFDFDNLGRIEQVGTLAHVESGENRSRVAFARPMAPPPWERLASSSPWPTAAWVRGGEASG
jgi:hypothetical protein